MKLCYQCREEPARPGGLCRECKRIYSKAWREKNRESIAQKRKAKNLSVALSNARHHKIPAWRKEWNEYFMGILGMPWTDAGYALSRVVDTRRLGRQMFKTYDDEGINRNVPPELIEGFVTEHQIRIERDEVKIREMGFHPNKIPAGVADRYIRKAV